MKRIIYITIALFLTGCGCTPKAKVLQQRSETMDLIQKKHGNILPPGISQVPDIEECQKPDSLNVKEK